MGSKEELEFEKELIKAKQGSPMYQCSVGASYLYGIGVGQNHNEALKWFCEASKSHYGTAYYYLGVCYEHGYGLSKDLKEALKWYERAREHCNWMTPTINAAINRVRGNKNITVADKSSQPKITAAHTNKIKEEPKGDLQIFYNSDDIKKVATVSAQVRDKAVQKDYDALLEAKKLSLYTFCPINYEIGHRLYEEADKLEKTWTADRYERLLAAIQDTGGRIFRYMIENFAEDKEKAECNLSAGLRSFFSRQTAKRITLNYNQIERLINGKLPEIAYERYKVETFWREGSVGFSKSWRDYGYRVVIVYPGNGNETEVVFEK